MLRLGGRSVPGFSLGAASSYAKASADLQAQVSDVVVKAGDAYYQADQKAFLLDYSDATKAYQAAGQAGASNVGPEIDAGGASSSTQPLTQQAWTLNGQLAQLVPSGAPDPSNGLTTAYYTQADADRARSLVVQMIDLYQQAIVAGSESSGQPVPQPSGPTPSPVPGAPQQPSSPATSSSSSGSSSPWLWLIPVAAAGGIFAAVVLQKGPRHAHA
jgi:hypothetical protein